MKILQRIGIGSPDATTGAMVNGNCPVPLVELVDGLRLRPFNAIEVSDYVNMLSQTPPDTQPGRPQPMLNPNKLLRIYFPKRLKPEECNNCPEGGMCPIDFSYLNPEDEINNPKKLAKPDTFLAFVVGNTVTPAFHIPPRCLLPPKTITNLGIPSPETDRKDNLTINFGIIFERIGITCKMCNFSECPINQIVNNEI